MCNCKKFLRAVVICWRKYSPDLKNYPLHEELNFFYLLLLAFYKLIGFLVAMALIIDKVNFPSGTAPVWEALFMLALGVTIFYGYRFVRNKMGKAWRKLSCCVRNKVDGALQRLFDETGSH